MDNSLSTAWAAGFLDGEGCFSLSKVSEKNAHPLTRTPMISATQVRREPLDTLQLLFGGSVTRQGERAWQWRLCSRDKVREACEALIPYLTLKRAEAEAVRDYAAVPRGNGRRCYTADEAALRALAIHGHAEARATHG